MLWSAYSECAEMVRSIFYNVHGVHIGCLARCGNFWCARARFPLTFFTWTKCMILYDGFPVLPPVSILPSVLTLHSLADVRPLTYSKLWCSPPLSPPSPAQVLLLVVPGGEKATTIDAEGHMALGVMRALGLPETVLAVQGVGNSINNNSHSGAGASSSSAGMAPVCLLMCTCVAFQQAAGLPLQL